MPEGYEIRGRKVRVYWWENGKLQREPLGAATPENIAKAKRLAEIIKFEIENGTFDRARHFPDSPHVRQDSFGHYLDLLLDIKKNDLALSSYRGIKSKAENHVRPRWGSLQISQIDHLDLQTWIQRDLAPKLHNKTIKEIVSIMRQVFRLYSTRNKASVDPTIGIIVRLPDDEDPDPFDLEEINMILSTPTTRIQELNLMKFMLWDGPRLSEALALAWEDVISIDKGLIRYRRAFVRSRYKVTKTKRSKRVHTLLKAARETLQEQWKLTGNLPSIEVEVVDRDNKTIRKVKIRPVFLNSQTGRIHSSDNAVRDRFWKTHLKNAGVRYRGPNQARHTFISQVLSSGIVPLHWITNHVGHSTTAMIERRYGKWIKQDGMDAHRMLETYFKH